MARRPALLLLVTSLALGGCVGGARSRPERPDPPPFAPSDAPAVAVPDVRGMALDAARASLESSGFRVGLIEPWPDSLGYAAGTVVAQRPARTTPAAPGTPVDLRVYGISDEDARHAMEASRPLPTDVPPAPPLPPPAAPEPAREPAAPPSGSPPAPAPPPPPSGGLEAKAVVPDLVGLPLAEAARVARAAGFDVVPLKVAGGTPGQVVSQDVEAGREAPLGSPIGIRVGK